MKDGQIAECGTHDQLMCKEREYANLFNSLKQEVGPQNTGTELAWTVYKPTRMEEQKKGKLTCLFKWLGLPNWYQQIIVKACFSSHSLYF